MIWRPRIEAALALPPAEMPSDFALNPSVRRDQKDLRPAAVLVGLHDLDGQTHVILTLRSENLASHTGQVAFPGGKIDPGETAEEAALREAQEEIDLHPSHVEILGRLDPYETGTGFQVEVIVGVVEAGFELTPNPHEVAEVFHVPLDFLMNAANHRTEDATWRGKRRLFYAMPWGDYYIWGATAGMLRNLHERVERVGRP